jgi:hypothetical protein
MPAASRPSEGISRNDFMVLRRVERIGPAGDIRFLFSHAFHLFSSFDFRPNSLSI